MKNEIRILCVEDVSADAALVNHALRKGGLRFRSKRVDTQEAFLHELEQRPPDVILSDHGLPSFDGFTALAIAQDKCPSVPFIFVTSALGEEMTISTFESGATDYVLKKDLSKLLPAVERALQEVDKRTTFKCEEQQLLESEERNRRLIEFCPDAFFIECDTQIVVANRAAARLLGAKNTEQIIGRPINEIVHADSREKFNQWLSQLRQSGTTFFWREIEKGNVGSLNEAGTAFPFVEEQFVRQDGSPVEVEMAATPITYQNRQAIQIIARDVTARKQAQMVLRQNEERLRLLVQNVKDYAIYLLDPAGNVVTWNAGAEKVKGFRAEEIIGKHFSTFFTPEDVAKGVPQELLERAERETEVQNEGVRVRRDGSRFWSQGIITALRDEQGRLRGFSKIAHDITRQKEAEEKIHQLNEQLEQRVRLRTSQLESANNELEAFSYSISHDLRAPLRHIAGYVEILKNEAAGQLDKQAGEYLQMIANSARNLGGLIDALLGFSRMGRTQMRTELLSLTDLVEEARRELQCDTENREIDWRIGKLPEVHGDPIMLRQAVIDLVSNALKYTRKLKRAKIEIGAMNSQSEIVFFIRDNGVGFDEKHANKLFGVFQRLHPVGEFEGIGIGLANVRRVIGRHGGRVWAEGRPDAGATFHFSLPKSWEGKTSV